MRGPAAVQPCHRSFAACSPAMSSGLRQRGGIAPAAPDDRRDGIARPSAGWPCTERPGSTPIRRKANRSTPLVACIETTQRRPRLRADGSIGGWLASREIRSARLAPGFDEGCDGATTAGVREPSWPIDRAWAPHDELPSYVRARVHLRNVRRAIRLRRLPLRYARDLSSFMSLDVDARWQEGWAQSTLPRSTLRLRSPRTHQEDAVSSFASVRHGPG